MILFQMSYLDLPFFHCLHFERFLHQCYMWLYFKCCIYSNTCTLFTFEKSVTSMLHMIIFQISLKYLFFYETHVTVNYCVLVLSNVLLDLYIYPLIDRPFIQLLSLRPILIDDEKIVKQNGINLPKKCY